MKILCQERYDKAVAYAKEIKNDTLHLTHSDSDKYIPMVEQELSEACSITDSPTNRLPY